MPVSVRAGLLLVCVTLSVALLARSQLGTEISSGGSGGGEISRSDSSQRYAELAANLDRNVIPLQPADIQIDLALQSTNGASLAEQLKGRWSVLFFGFTHCPHVCPMTLASLARAARLESGPLAERSAQVVFISIDPVRDSPEQVSAYLAGFSQDFVGFTGEESAIARLSASIGAGYEHSGQAVNEIDHSTALFVVNPNAQLSGLILKPRGPAAIASDLEDLMAQSSKPQRSHVGG